MTSSPPIAGHLYSPRVNAATMPSVERFLIQDADLPLSPEPATIERMDDSPLLTARIQRIGLDAVIDTIIPRHWLHQGLRIGQ